MKKPSLKNDDKEKVLMLTLNDIVSDWDAIKSSKKRNALQAIINYIDFEEPDTDDLLLALIETARDFENNDYFGTEGLIV